MATAYTVPPMLKARRSQQSGIKAMTAAWQTVYTSSSPYAYLFIGAEIDLTPMQAGDSIEIRTTKVVVSGGAPVVHHGIPVFTGVQPVNHKTAHIGPIMDVYGVNIEIRQTAGVLRNIDCEFYDAKR